MFSSARGRDLPAPSSTACGISNSRINNNRYMGGGDAADVALLTPSTAQVVEANSEDLEQLCRSASAASAAMPIIRRGAHKPRLSRELVVTGREHSHDCMRQKYIQSRLSAQLAERERELQRDEDPTAAVCDGKETEEYRAPALRHVAFARSNRGACYCMLSEKELKRRDYHLHRLVERANDMFGRRTLANYTKHDFFAEKAKASDVRGAHEGFIQWVRTGSTQGTEPAKQFVRAARHRSPLSCRSVSSLPPRVPPHVPFPPRARKCMHERMTDPFSLFLSACALRSPRTCACGGSVLQEALQSCAQQAGILEGKIGRYRFKTDAKESFLFTTPNFEQMFNLDPNADDASTWYLTVRTWQPIADSITADGIVHFFETKFAEQAQSLPGFKMYFGCVLYDDSGVETAVSVPSPFLCPARCWRS